jgi:hypothetical protein
LLSFTARNSRRQFPSNPGVTALSAVKPSNENILNTGRINLPEHSTNCFVKIFL